MSQIFTSELVDKMIRRGGQLRRLAGGGGGALRDRRGIGNIHSVLEVLPQALAVSCQNLCLTFA